MILRRVPTRCFMPGQITFLIARDEELFEENSASSFYATINDSDENGFKLYRSFNVLLQGFARRAVDKWNEETGGLRSYAAFLAWTFSDK